MRNKTMRRSLAWLLTAATVLGSVPVSAEELVTEQSVDLEAEAQGETDAGENPEESTGDDSTEEELTLESENDSAEENAVVIDGSSDAEQDGGTIGEASQISGQQGESEPYSYVYTGKEITVQTDDGVTVTEGTASATNVGEYTVEVTDAEGVTSEITWKIIPAELTATCYYAEGKSETEDAEATEENADIEVAVEVTGFVDGEDEENAAGYVAPQYTQPVTLEDAATMKAFGGEADNYTFVYADSVEVVNEEELAVLSEDEEDWKEYSWVGKGKEEGKFATVEVLSYNPEIAERLTDDCELEVEDITEGTDYENMRTLLNEKHSNSVQKFGYIKLVLKDKDGKEINLEDSLTMLKLSYAGEMGTVSNTPSYVYGISKKNLIEGRFEEDGTPAYTPGVGVSFTSLLFPGTNEIAVVAADDLEKQIDPGVYTVTANLTVLSQNNTVLPFPVQVYVGNPNFPPVTPLSYNAKLVVDEAGNKTITIEGFSEIFQIFSMESGETIHIESYEKVPSKSDTLGDTIGNMTVQYRHEERINKLVLKIDDTTGLYEFGPCVQSPIILDEDTQMKMHLQVNFDEITKGFDESKGTVNSQTFTDEASGITVDVQTTEENVAKALENAKLEVKESTDDVSKQMVREMYYNGTVDFKLYDITLKDADGKEIDLSDAGNTNTTLTMKTTYAVNRLWKLDGLTMKKMRATSSKNKIVYTDMTTGLGTFAVVDNNSAKQYAVAKTIAGDAMAVVSQRQTDGVSMINVTEDSDLASYAVTLNVKKKTTDMGNAYYLSAFNKADNSAIRNFGDGTQKLDLYIPYDGSKNYYFVTDNGSSVAVKKLDTSDNCGKYVMLQILEETRPADAMSYFVLNRALNQAYESGNGNDALIGCYILVTDKNIASAPMNVIGTSGEKNEIVYSGTEQQVIAEGEHYNVISGTKSAVNAGTVTLTVKPEEGYVWANGSNEEKTVTGEIKKHKLGVRYKGDAVLVNGTPKLEIEYGYSDSNMTITRTEYQFVNGETEETASGFVAPKVPTHATDVAGDFTLTPEGGSADNYEFVLLSGVLHVKENADHIVKIPEIWTDSVYPVIKKTEKSRTYIVPKEEQTIKTVKAFDVPDENAGYTLSSNHLSASLSTNQVGVYSIQANVKDGYVWEDGTTRTKYYTLYLYQIIDRPSAKENLVFNGKEQSPFDEETITAGEGKWGFVNQTIYKATELGDYVTKITPKSGYCWDETGDASTLTYNWSIVSSDEKEVASTETITANLALKGSDAYEAGLAVLQGLVGADGYAYLTNPNAPTANSNEDNDPNWQQAPPTTPVNDNATLITYKDGTMALKVPVKNAVFTLQELGSSDQVAADDVTITRRNGTYGTNTSRIDSITIPVTAKTGRITFNGCVVYPTLFGTSYMVPLTLTYGTAAVQEKTSISGAAVSGITDAVYTGSAITQPNLKVTIGNGLVTLKEGTDYSVSYSNNVNPGTATITITGIGNYKDSVTKTFTIAEAKKDDNISGKAKQIVTVKVGAKSYKYTSLQKKKASFSIGATASGRLTYKVTAVPKNGKKYITVDKNGKVTLKKKAPAGTYKVTVSAAATSTQEAGSYVVTVTVNKKAQKVTAKTSSKTIKAKKIAKKNQSFTIGAKGKGKLTYKVISTPQNAGKYISVNKHGKVTIKKKAPKGTYQIMVTAAGNATYAKATKTITVKVK